MKYFYMHGKDRVVTVGYEWDRGNNRVHLAPIASCATKGRWTTNYGPGFKEHHVWLEPDQFNKRIARSIVEGRAQKHGMIGFSFVAENRHQLYNKLIEMYHPLRKERKKAKKWLQENKPNLQELPF